MNQKTRIYFIAFYLVLSGVIICKYGIETNSYLHIAFGASSFLFLIALLKGASSRAVGGGDEDRSDQGH
jgi:hypothetical protein